MTSPNGWARVRLTVEIDVGPYLAETSVRALFEEAGRQGVQTIHDIASKNRLRVVGEPEVQVVCVNKDVAK